MLTMLGFGVLGGVSLPIKPAFYEFSSELAFPVGEGSALGYLIGIISFIALISGILFSHFIIWISININNQLQSCICYLLYMFCWFCFFNESKFKKYVSRNK